MRLDTQRVEAIAEALPKARLDRTQGERMAADMVAASFEATGLQVQRIAAPLVPFPIWVFAILHAFTLCLVILAAKSALPGIHRAWLTALLAPPLLLGAWWAERGARMAGRAERSHHIIGRPMMKDVPSLRVILLTSITSLVATQQFVSWVGLLILNSLSVIALMTPWYERVGSQNPDVTLGLLFCVWLSSMLFVLTQSWRAARPKRGDNRTGLAMLMELAKHWPAGLADKIETVFVASPNPLALGTFLQSQSAAAQPTLVIKLDATGVGSELVIAGRGIAHEIAKAAARELWIPHRSSSRTFGLLFMTLRESGAFCVAFRGKHDDSPIDPALLSATAQLVMETTLRWMKQAMPTKGPLDRDALE